METYIVLGAGVAGLNAALHLSESTGRRVLVLEKEPRVGGLAASLDWKGARLDLGPHRIYTEIPGIRELINDLVGDELIQVQRSSHMYLNRRFLAYPPRISQMALALGPSKLLRWGTSYLASQIFGAKSLSNAETYETFLRQQFGSALYQDFFLPFARKVWGKMPSELSSDIVKTRVASKSLLHALLGKTEKKGRPGTLREFPYPKKGIGTIAERLSARLQARGVHIVLEAEPTLIKMSSKGSVLVAFQDRRSDQMVTADVQGVVSTVPLMELISILRVPGQAEAAATVRNLRHVSMMLVYFLLDKERVRHDTWMYFPEPDIIFGRACEVRNYSPFAVPEGKTVLCAEVASPPETVSRADLVARVEKDMMRIGLFQSSEVESILCVDLLYAYPLYELGYQTHLRKVLDFLSPMGQFVTTGRQGLFAYNNLDHSLHIGKLAAEALLNGPDAVREFYQQRDKICEYQIVD